MYIDKEDNEFEWDERKDRSNYKKHGIRFDDAKRIFRGWMLTKLDRRNRYEEQRYLSIGNAGNDTVLAVVFTHRERIRIISARKANDYEREIYEAFIKKASERNRRN